MAGQGVEGCWGPGGPCSPAVGPDSPLFFSGAPGALAPALSLVSTLPMSSSGLLRFRFWPVERVYWSSGSQKLEQLSVLPSPSVPLLLICFSLASSVTAPLPPLSGLALFLIVFFSLVFSVFAIVIGIILYNKWQDQSRKRFY